MFKQRFLTAVLLGPLVLLAVFMLPLGAFAAGVALVALQGASEWANLCRLNGARKALYILLVAVSLALLYTLRDTVLAQLVLALAALFWLAALVLVLRYPSTQGFSHAAVKMAGGLFVLVPVWLALVQMKALQHGNLALLMLLLLVWGADIGAYCAGKLWGRNKLIPRVSPGKTREGLFGGVLSCLLIAVGIWFWRELPPASLVYLMALALMTCLAAVLGDLFESMLKRERGIKDSGRLLPGHGGVLDRIDSLTAAAPVFMLGLYWVPLS